jgi:nucleotide-binding universal stress UspA family protein
MKLHNIVIALPLENELLAPLHAWGKKFNWSEVRSVHFIHVVKKNITPLEFGLVEMPDEKTFLEMKPSLERFLRDEARKILPEGHRGEQHFHLKKDFNPDEEIIETLRQVKADLVVVATQGKHGFEGLFHNSMTDHLVRFAPCDVYVVRPHQ